MGFHRRERVAGCIGAPFGKERRAVEAVELFLRQPTHHVRNISLVDALPESALESVSVEEPHEKLEVRFLAVVRCCRHQQEITGSSAEKLAELVALSLLHLATEVGCCHSVGFIANDQVPVRCSIEFRLQFIGPGRHVQAHDQPVTLDKWISGDRCLDLIAGNRIKVQIELFFQFILPLFDQAAGRDYEAAFEVAPDQQLLDE